MTKTCLTFEGLAFGAAAWCGAGLGAGAEAGAAAAGAAGAATGAGAEAGADVVADGHLVVEAAEVGLLEGEALDELVAPGHERRVGRVGRLGTRRWRAGARGPRDAVGGDHARRRPAVLGPGTAHASQE